MLSNNTFQGPLEKDYYFLSVLSLEGLSKFTKEYNIPDTKRLEFINKAKESYANCFQGLNIEFLEENTVFSKVVYAFLITRTFDLVSFLSIHFFRNDDTVDKYNIKIHNVCASIKGGTKILFKIVLDKIKPIAKTIWLNVLYDNRYRAYDLYLDLGFEFVFNNQNISIDMIYNKNNKIISSKDNPDEYKSEQIERNHIIIDMIRKIYTNYLNIIDDVVITSLSSQYYIIDEKKKEEEDYDEGFYDEGFYDEFYEKKQEKNEKKYDEEDYYEFKIDYEDEDYELKIEDKTIKNFMDHVNSFLNPRHKFNAVVYDIEEEVVKQPVLQFTKGEQQNFIFITYNFS
jgi:hypothetical protein